MRLPQKQPHAARAPDGAVVYAVGDVHGRLDLLACATGEIEAQAAKTRSETRTIAVFLGDYIDRGPQPAQVLDHLIALKGRAPCELVFLRGNHEQVLLDLVSGQDPSSRWLDYGGRETLASYGAGLARGASPSDAALREAAVKAVPAAHLAFLNATELYRKLGDYLFVHAGLRPDRLIEEQSPADMLWYRQLSDEPALWTETVVHGHSPNPLPVEGRTHIGIDTGASETGALTVLRLEGAQRAFLRVLSAPDRSIIDITRWPAVDARYSLRQDERRETAGWGRVLGPTTR